MALNISEPSLDAEVFADARGNVGVVYRVWGCDRRKEEFREWELAEAALHNEIRRAQRVLALLAQRQVS